jgi:hypothetical protein
VRNVFASFEDLMLYLSVGQSDFPQLSSKLLLGHQLPQFHRTIGKNRIDVCDSKSLAL